MKGDDYSGYAVTSGMFREGGPQYVFGSPRAGQFRTGQVFLIEPFLGEEQKEMKLIQRLSGLQLGEYFGAAIVAVDLDGNGLDDLVVGSPLATFEEARKKRSTTGYAKRFEEGKITVFYNNE